MIRPRCLLPIAFALVPISCLPAQTIKGSTHEPSFTPGWPADSNWQRYVLGPSTAIARPVRIVSTAGQVENAAALLTSATGNSATLTRTANDGSPTNIVLDYGIDVGGLPAIDVTAARLAPVARQLQRIAALPHPRWRPRPFP